MGALACTRLVNMTSTITAEWLQNPLVRRAALDSGWRDNGDTVGFLYQLLDLTERDCLDSCETTEHVGRGTRESISDIAMILADGDYASTGGFHYEGTGHGNTMVSKTAMLLMDVGADPDNLIKAGYPPNVVQGVVERYEPWRQDAVRMAAEGLDVQSLYMALPSHVDWRKASRVLEQHGYVYQTSPRRLKQTTIDLILRVVYGGESTSVVARDLGLTEEGASSLVADYRSGKKYMHHHQMFERLAA